VFKPEKLLLDESPDAIIATAPDGTVVYWSRGAERMFGYTSTEASGRLLHDLIIPPDYIEEEGCVLQRALENGSTGCYESLRKNRDGSLLYVDITSKLVPDDKGKIDFILSSKKDITGLKAGRDARYIRARYGELLESTPDGIVMVNATGRIVFSNSQAARLFGYQDDELLGKPI